MHYHNLCSCPMTFNSDTLSEIWPSTIAKLAAGNIVHTCVSRVRKGKIVPKSFTLPYALYSSWKLSYDVVQKLNSGWIHTHTGFIYIYTDLHSQRFFYLTSALFLIKPALYVSIKCMTNTVYDHNDPDNI